MLPSRNEIKRKMKRHESETCLLFAYSPTMPTILHLLSSIDLKEDP
jgi:hypothetical protein